MDTNDSSQHDLTVSPELVQWIEERTRYFLSIGGHGSLEIIFQDGHPITYRDMYSHKVSGRTRIRTTRTIK